MLLVSVADGHIATPILLGKPHSEVGWPVPFFAVFRFPVIDRYPLRLGEPRSGQSVVRLELRTFKTAVTHATT